MFRTILLATALCGCAGAGTSEDPDDGIQVGSEGAFGCTVATVTPVDDPEATIPELGQSAGDAIAGLSGAFSGPGETHDGTAVDVALAISELAELAWITTEGPGGGTEACPPYLSGAIDADVDAGETFAATGMVGTVSVASQGTLLRATLPIEHTSGSLAPRYADPDSLDYVDAHVLAEQVSGQWEGVVGFQGCAGEACSPPVQLDDAELSWTVAP